LPNPTLSQWKSALVVGSFLFLGGNGLVTWAEQEIPSGIAALVIATMPMWMTLFDWLFFGGSKPSIKIAVGVALGIIGIVLLIGPADVLAGTTELNLFYLMGLVFAPIFWSIGSLISRKSDLPPNVFMANASEMLCGGAVVLLVSVFFGEPFAFQFSQVETKAWFCMLYLTIFGSMIALTAYAWLLKNATAAKVATYSYVNPVIALFLGWLILNEQITWQTALAVIVIIAGVVLIVTDKNRSPKLKETEIESDQTDFEIGTSKKEYEEPCEVGV
jgi:drug/metabolite transporter (DMT)-like permease